MRVTTAPSATSVIYVVGEVLISLAVIVGAFVLLLQQHADPVVTPIASGMLASVTVFWFQRRAAEQASNNLATLADGKLTQLLEAQNTNAATSQQLLAVMASTAAASRASAQSSATSADNARATLDAAAATPVEHL